jgi:hypothetical protein
MRARRSPGRWESSDAAWKGGRRRYDLISELIASGVVVLFLVVTLSVLFGSPDPPAVTMEQWATQAPGDFIGTTLTEVDGTSGAATYGPPYQPASEQNGSLQGFGPISPQEWVGVTIPIDTFTDFVAQPLRTVPDDGTVERALQQWQAAPAAEQTAWAAAYTEALAKASFSDGAYDVPAGDYGPLGPILEAQYELALSGGLDNALLASSDPAQPYSNDQTRLLLYMGDSGQTGGASSCISAGQAVPVPDGCWYYNQSVANTAPRHAGYLSGGTWGVINEVGNWPGAWWLFPYSFWYQWGYGANGASGDLYAMLCTGVVSLLFLALPWIPGLRDIPKLTRVYRIMWGDYYRMVERRRSGTSTAGPT